MGRLTLVTGGARSGKSTFAESLARARAKSPSGVTVVATLEAHDEEMQRRIALHRQQRESLWMTIEPPGDLVEKIQQTPSDIFLLDCLGGYVSTQMFAVESEPDPVVEMTVQKSVDALVAAMQDRSDEVIIVTNEVGDSVIPEYRLGRLFRDILGRSNQRLAAQADEVYLVVVGIPMKLKG